MEEFASIISNLGFPVAIAVYLLFRFEKKIDNLEKTIDTSINGKDGVSAAVRDLTNKIGSICLRNSK